MCTRRKRKVPLNQIDNDEMNLLVKMLSDTRNIAAGENERILSEVVKQLIRMSQVRDLHFLKKQLFFRLRSSIWCHRRPTSTKF